MEAHFIHKLFYVVQWVDLSLSLWFLWIPVSYKITKPVGRFMSDNDVGRDERLSSILQQEIPTKISNILYKFLY